MGEPAVAMSIVKDAPNGNVYYELDGEGDGDSSTTPYHPPDSHDRSESPVFGLEGAAANANGNTGLRIVPHELPNEISAPYEVPQFPIEQIEKKLLIQRQLTVKLGYQEFAYNRR